MTPSTSINGSVRTWRRYPSYKDAGVPWLKMVPTAWKTVRLKFLATFCGGGTPSKDNLEFWKGEIPWVSPKDMKLEIIEDTEDHISDAAVANSSTRLIPAGVVLVVVRSGILRHSIPVAVTAREMALNQDMRAIMPKANIRAEYLAAVIRGHQPELLNEWGKQGATVESIEVEYLTNTTFPVPSLEEQGQIIAFLEKETAKIDALITKKERLIELLQEKRTALVSHAVTKGLDPDVPMKDSGIEWAGKIPAHWGKKRAKFLFRQMSLPVREGDGVVTAFRDGQVTLRENRRTEGYTFAILELGYQGIRQGHLVLHSMDAFAGAIGISESDGKCSPEYIVWTPSLRIQSLDSLPLACGKCHVRASSKCPARPFVNVPHAFASQHSGRCGSRSLLERSRSKSPLTSKEAATATTSIFASCVRRLALSVNTAPP